MPSLKQYVTAFEQLEAEHITLQVSPNNGPALICFENAGLQYLSYTDTTEQAYTMGIERSEWSGEKVVDEEGRCSTVECSTQGVFRSRRMIFLAKTDCV